MSYRASIVAFYARNPKATQEQCRKATGAPKRAVRFVYGQLVAAGRLSRAPNADGKARAYGLPSAHYGQTGSKDWGSPRSRAFWAGPGDGRT